MESIDIKKRLFSMAEDEYKSFESKLLPTVDKYTIIGVRAPLIRAFAEEIRDSKEARDFLGCLPHKYYEEYMLHAFLVSGMRDYDRCTEELERLLPYIDNWGVCDSLRPACFAKNRQNLLGKVYFWINSAHSYTVRFGIEMLMVHFLDGDFQADMLSAVAKIKSGEYYVSMMIAWYFATALAKRYDAALPYIEAHILPSDTHRRTIQKAVESRRVDGDKKEYLKSLRSEVKNFDFKEQFNTYIERKELVEFYLGKTVRIEMDRPIGSPHPKRAEIVYPINYGYIPDVLGGDGEELDVYLLGVDVPVSEYTAKIIGIVHRHNDIEDKLVAAPENMSYTAEEIAKEVHFQEKYYFSHIQLEADI